MRKLFSVIIFSLAVVTGFFEISYAWNYVKVSDSSGYWYEVDGKRITQIATSYRPWIGGGGQQDILELQVVGNRAFWRFSDYSSILPDLNGNGYYYVELPCNASNTYKLIAQATGKEHSISDFRVSGNTVYWKYDGKDRSIDLGNSSNPVPPPIPPPSKTLTKVTVSGASSVIGGSNADYTATAKFSDGSESNVTQSASWSVISSYAQMSSSVKGKLITSAVPSDQKVAVTASYTYGGVTKIMAKNITIVKKPGTVKTLTGVTISGASSITEGNSADYTATAKFSDGSASNVTQSATWSENSDYAKMDSSVKGRLITSSVSANIKVTITASYTYGGVTKKGTLNITIINKAEPSKKTLTSVTVSGASSVIGGSNSDYTVSAKFSDGSVSFVAQSSSWSVTSSYAKMDSSKKGRLITSVVPSDQKVTITASYTYGGVTKSGLFYITIVKSTPKKTLTSVTIFGNPIVNENSSANENPSATYSAVAGFSDGSSQIITDLASWIEDSSYAQMSSSVKGKLITSAVPSDQKVIITVSYTYSGVTKKGTLNVTIVKKAGTVETLTGVTVSGSSSVIGGSNADYTATAKFSDGSTSDVTQSASWIEDSSYTQMSSSVKGKLITSAVLSDQKVTITASYTNGGVTKEGTLSVTIVSATLTSVTVSGKFWRVPGGSTTNYTATAKFSDGSTSDVTQSASWSENSDYAKMDSYTKGRLIASTVPKNMTAMGVTITASYTHGGVTKKGTFNVTIMKYGGYARARNMADETSETLYSDTSLPNLSNAPNDLYYFFQWEVNGNGNKLQIYADPPNANQTAAITYGLWDDRSFDTIFTNVSLPFTICPAEDGWIAPDGTLFIIQVVFPNSVSPVTVKAQPLF